MKKLVWITPDYFIDCDFNLTVLSEILKYYNIHWIILLPTKNARFKETDFSELEKFERLSIQFIYWNCRARSPKMLLFFEKVYRQINKNKCDLIYFNYIPSSPYILPLYWRLNKKKTIFTAHDGSVKSSFRIPWISKMVFKFAFNTIRYVNMFSPTQAEIFQSNFTKVEIFIIPLSLKDYGTSSLPKRNDNIIFFFFGSIHLGKNIELLIDAACSLYEEGEKGFKISINGICPNWEIYQSKIKYPDLFELNIRMIENIEIPDLFAQSHYMIFPYKEMSQSGALKVAFNYNVPVIVSSLRGFTDEVIEEINGYIFETQNILSLKQIIKQCLKNHNKEYVTLCNKMNKYTLENYSQMSIAKKYIEMFQSVNHTIEQ